MNTRKKKDFTLVELFTVMVIIAVLLSISLGLFLLVSDKVKISRTEAIVKQISVAMQAYRADQGYYLVNTATLQPLSSATDPVDSSNRFRFNLGGNVDTELVKYLDYETLKGKGHIQTVTGVNGYSYIVDAWGMSLLYRTPNGNPPTNSVVNSTMFDIGSLGKDGKYGDNSVNPSDFGKGDDITNFNY